MLIWPFAVENLSYHKFLDRQVFANSVDPNQMRQNKKSKI